MVATSIGPCARCEDPGSAGLYRCPTIEGKVCWKCLRREMGDTRGSVEEPREIDSVPDGVNASSRNGMAASSLVSFDQIVAVPVKWLSQDRVALSKITGLAGRPKTRMRTAGRAAGRSRATSKMLATCWRVRVCGV